MQTLERSQDPGSDTDASRRSTGRHTVALVCALVVVLGAVAAAYLMGRSQRSSEPVVRALPPAPTSTPASDDRGFNRLDNGHQDETSGFDAPLDAATRAQLQHELILARSVAMKYPTVADAERNGWQPAGPFFPGIGTHFFKWSGSDGTNFVPVVGTMADHAVLTPASLIYDGTHPDSPIAGLMYLGDGLRIPQGFAGPNDVWHYHTDACYVMKPSGGIDVPFGIDTSVSKSMCNGVHGTLLTRTPNMLHVWIVPGYDSAQGVFSHDNEAITCRDGTYHMIAIAHLGTRKSACVDGGE
jgi:hypothetical protein